MNRLSFLKSLFIAPSLAKAVIDSKPTPELKITLNDNKNHSLSINGSLFLINPTEGQMIFSKEESSRGLWVYNRGEWRTLIAKVYSGTL